MKKILGLCLALLLAACTQTPPPPPTHSNPLAVAWQRPAEVINLQNVARLRLTGSLLEHRTTVSQLVINANSQRLATIGGNSQFMIWNIASGRTLLNSATVPISAVFFLPDAAFVLSLGEDEQLRKWSLQDGVQTAQVVAHEHSISAAALAPDGGRLVVGGINGVLNIFETATLEKVDSVSIHMGGFYAQSLHFSPNGRVLYSVGSEGAVVGWDTSTWGRIRQLEQGYPPPLSAVHSADHNLLAIIRAEGVQIYALDSGERLNSFAIPPFEYVTEATFSPDNTWLAWGGDLDSVVVFNVASGELVVALRGHGQNFVDLAFAPDSRLLLTGVGGGAAYMWNLNDLPPQAPDEIQIQRAVLSQVADLKLNTLRWSADGKYIVLADRVGGVFVLSIP